MRNNWLGKTRSRSSTRRRGFSLSELMVVIAIIGVVLGVAVPSIVVAVKDVELKQAKTSIYAALEKARSRALSERRMIALHIFRDGAAYAAGRNSTDPTAAAYNQSSSFRWGTFVDSSTGIMYGMPHVPTNKLVMRLEAPYAVNSDNAVKFIYPGDYDPIVLPDSLGVAQPGTILNYYVKTDGGVVRVYEDFYIVFDADGKIVSVLPDYNLSGVASTLLNYTAVDASGVAILKSGNPIYLWSATGLCIYDVQKFKSLSDDGDSDMADVDQYSYVNRPDNQVIISPYTGMPLSMEVGK